MTEVDTITTLAQALVEELLVAGVQVATAESCTGGWVAKSITDVAGSSACFGYGIVSYSNAAKQSLLGVSAETLAAHGAVSEATVVEMAEGVLAVSGAGLSVAVSGIAGPDGGTAQKPVGTVYFAWSLRGDDETGTETALRTLRGDRHDVRRQSVVIALQGLRERLRSEP